MMTSGFWLARLRRQLQLWIGMDYAQKHLRMAQWKMYSSIILRLALLMRAVLCQQGRANWTMVPHVAGKQIMMKMTIAIVVTLCPGWGT